MKGIHRPSPSPEMGKEHDICSNQKDFNDLRAETTDRVEAGYGDCRKCRKSPQAVFCALSPSLPMVCSRMTNFWILPVIVMGNSATNSM
jgi:hypothetical protein